MDALFQLDYVTLDLFPEEDFQPVIRKLSSNFLQGALGSCGNRDRAAAIPVFERVPSMTIAKKISVS